MFRSFEKDKNFWLLLIVYLVSFVLSAGRVWGGALALAWALFFFGNILLFCFLFLNLRHKFLALVIIFVAWIATVALPKSPIYDSASTLGFLYLVMGLTMLVLKSAWDFARNPKKVIGDLREALKPKPIPERPGFSVGTKFGELRQSGVSIVESVLINDPKEVRGLEEKRKKEYEWRGTNSEFRIDPFSEANPHINISGISGYGKSTLCKRLVSEIHRRYGVPVTILDIHNEYSGLINSIGGEVLSLQEITIGIWELNNESPREKILENVSIFDRVMNMGDIQAYYLGKCAERAYERKGFLLSKKITSAQVPGLKDILEEADKWISLQRWPDKSLVSMRRRLEIVEMSGIFAQQTVIPFEKVLEKPVNFELAGLRSSEVQAIFIEIFLRKLYQFMLQGEKNVDKVKLFVLIDEAQNVCVSSAKEPSFAGKISAEARKYGIGLITSNQMAQDLDKAIIGNAAITFAFYQKEPKEAKYIIEMMAGPDYEKQVTLNKQFSHLQKFECLCINTHQRMASLIRIKPLPFVPEEKTATEKDAQVEVPEPALREKPVLSKVVGEKEGMEKIVTEILDGKGLKYKRFGGVKHPDFAVKKDGVLVGVELETSKKKPVKIKKEIANKLKNYSQLIIVVHSSLKNHYAKAARNLSVKVVTVNEFKDAV